MKNFAMKASELAQAVGGKLLGCDNAIQGIGSDTRADLKGQLFVPFVGDNFDAHDFIGKAVENGATAILAERGVEQVSDLNTVSFIQVDNTLLAFQKLARYWREKKTATVVAITGSNGKTTTKEFAAAILSPELSISWSQKSFNNHWGVPISLLSIESEHQCALIEMGMNNPGEIAKLVQIADPDVSLCTIVGETHLEGMGSVEAISNEKEQIYLASSDRALKIYNLDNPHTAGMYERHGKKGLTFSQSRKDVDVFMEIASADLSMLKVRGCVSDVEGGAEVPIFGSHNITNLMAASCIALSLNIDPQKIWKNLPLCQNAWGRGRLLEHQSGAQVLFDGYNSSPESAKALMHSLQGLRFSGRKYAVLGEMLELGADTAAKHRELGELVGKMGFSGVWFVGSSKLEFEAGIKTSGFCEKLMISDVCEDSLALEFASMLDRGDIVAVKGSRGVALEKVLTHWGLSL